MKSGLRWCGIMSLVVAVGISALDARADEISDQIKEGLALYEKGNLSEAASALNFAVGQIHQRQAAGLKGVFPEPQQGWKAEETAGEFGSAPLLGGGVSASRHYYVENGDKSVDIEMVTDSPMLQSVLMFYTNPSYYANQPDTKLTKVQGRKAVQKFSPRDKDGEINIVIGSRMLVSIKGHDLDSADEMVNYANAIDFAALEKFLEK